MIRTQHVSKCVDYFQVTFILTRCDTDASLCNHCCSGKAKSITYSECVFVAVGILHVMRMPQYCHLWPARLHSIFPHHLINGTICNNKKIIEHKMCVLIFYNFCLKYFSFLKKKKQCTIKSVYWSSCKVPVTLVRA